MTHSTYNESSMQIPQIVQKSKYLKQPNKFHHTSDKFIDQLKKISIEAKKL